MAGAAARAVASATAARATASFRIALISSATASKMVSVLGWMLMLGPCWILEIPIVAGAAAAAAKAAGAPATAATGPVAPTGRTVPVATGGTTPRALASMPVSGGASPRAGGATPRTPPVPAAAFHRGTGSYGGRSGCGGFWFCFAYGMGCFERTLLLSI